MGTRNLFQCGSNEQGEDQKKKGLQFKNFHKFWLSSQNFCDFPRIFIDQKKKREGLGPKSFMKLGVSLQKLRKYGQKTPIWES